ncbi:MAG: substrate-binding domain-containing protein [Planctomycetaceae bacterium]|nr:substrate-binding domain-containing protein [Planctomycetaceae bacterium]
MSKKNDFFALKRLLAFLAIVVLLTPAMTGCRKAEPVKLRIAADIKFFPLLEALKKELRENFPIDIQMETFEPGELLLRENLEIDLLLADYLLLLDTLDEKGAILEKIPFSYASPVIIFRKSDRFAFASPGKISKLSGKPPRVTFASRNNNTMQQLTRNMLTRNNIVIDGDSPMVTFVPLIFPTNGDTVNAYRENRSVPSIMIAIQMLRDHETDIIVAWDFVAKSVFADPQIADQFAKSNWPPDDQSTIILSFCIMKDCKNIATCQTLIDFLKSGKGRQILQEQQFTLLP